MSCLSYFESIDCSRIGCIGGGYVGGPTMAVIADQCPHLQVVVADSNSDRIWAWNSPDLPIYEPGLDEIVRRCRGRNLTFTTDVAKMIEDCDIIFVSVNTPTKQHGFGAGKAADLCNVESSARLIAKHSTRSKIVVEKSTVPVRTAAAIRRVLEAVESKHIHYVILSNPEFLAEGTAVADLNNPDRVLVGGPDTEQGAFAIAQLCKIYACWVPSDNIITTNLWSSELSKLVANAFLAQRISSINSISQLCERTEADVRQVAYAIGKDHRIGSAFLNASLGFGGSCFKKDVLNLVYLCERFELNDVAKYWKAVVDMNECQMLRFSRRIVTALFNSVHNKRIAIFGFAFKKNTSDVRETPAVTICSHLMREGAILTVYDPKVHRDAAILEFERQGAGGAFHLSSQFHMTNRPMVAVEQAHGIVICTAWDEFKDCDYEGFYQRMEKPAFVFDGTNILDHKNIANIGYEVHAVGQATFQINNIRESHESIRKKKKDPRP